MEKRGVNGLVPVIKYTAQNIETHPAWTGDIIIMRPGTINILSELHSASVDRSSLSRPHTVPFSLFLSFLSVRFPVRPPTFYLFPRNRERIWQIPSNSIETPFCQKQS